MNEVETVRKESLLVLETAPIKIRHPSHSPVHFGHIVAEIIHFHPVKITPVVFLHVDVVPREAHRSFDGSFDVPGAAYIV